MLTDSHCHLSFKDYPETELGGILQRAFENDVTTLITIGAGEGIEGNAAAVSLAQKYPQIFATVGIHPHDAKLVHQGNGESINGQGDPVNGHGEPVEPSLGSGSVMTHIEQLAGDPKVVAIGEVGLDFHYEHSPRGVQERVFAAFVDLSNRVGKPLVIHDRGAGDRTYEILKSHLEKLPPPAVIHCFTGTKELAKKYLDLGCLISFSGIVTFKKADDLREVVKMVPVEKMLIETDSPFLAPEPFRGKRNEPAFVKRVAETIAEIKSLSLEDVARITTLNAKRFFKLPLPELVAQVAYAIRDSLYLNITNRCTLACTFCPKFIDFEVKGYFLKLPKEPTVEEVLAQIGDPSKYAEVVFCGYGEPTRRLDDLKEIAGRLRKKFPHIKLRLNTDGLGNLVHQRDIIPELSPLIDRVSVSLNAADAATYAKYCPSKYREAAYPAVKDFIRNAVGKFSEVTATVVGMPDIDQKSCRKIAEEELGARFRFRPLNEVG